MSLKTSSKVARGDHLAVLRDATTRLMESVDVEVAELVLLDESSRPHIDALIHDHVHAPKPAPEFEASLWQTVGSYLENLDSAYRRQQNVMHKDARQANQALKHR